MPDRCPRDPHPEVPQEFCESRRCRFHGMGSRSNRTLQMLLWSYASRTSCRWRRQLFLQEAVCRATVCARRTPSACGPTLMRVAKSLLARTSYQLYASPGAEERTSLEPRGQRPSVRFGLSWSPGWHPCGPRVVPVLAPRPFRGRCHPRLWALFEALRPWAFEPQRLSVSFVTAKRSDIMAEHRDNGCSVVAGQQGLCVLFLYLIYLCILSRIT